MVNTPLRAAVRVVAKWAHVLGLRRAGRVQMDVQSVPLAQQVESLTRRLVDDYAGQFPDQVVRGLVDEAFSDYRHAKVQQFVPVLVARSVRQQLRSTALTP